MDYMTEFENVIKEFCIKGRLVSVSPYGEGHINGTYLVDTDETKYILQHCHKQQKALLPNALYLHNIPMGLGHGTCRLFYPACSHNLPDNQYQQYDRSHNNDKLHQRKRNPPGKQTHPLGQPLVDTIGKDLFRYLYVTLCQIVKKKPQRNQKQHYISFSQ